MKLPINLILYIILLLLSIYRPQHHALRHTQSLFVPQVQIPRFPPKHQVKLQFLYSSLLRFFRQILNIMVATFWAFNLPWFLLGRDFNLLLSFQTFKPCHIIKKIIRYIYIIILFCIILKRYEVYRRKETVQIIFCQIIAAWNVLNVAL
jgi:hypothetical protein